MTLIKKSGRVQQGVNFINIFCTNMFWQLLSSYMYVAKAAKTTFVRKICTFNIDEIDNRCHLNSICFEKFDFDATGKNHDLEQWIPTGVPRNTGVPWNGSMGSAKYWIFLIFLVFLANLINNNQLQVCLKVVR